MEYDKCMLRFHRRAVPSESGGRHSQVRIAAGGSELGWRMEDESFQVSEDREGGASGMIHDTRGENAANSGRPDQMHNTSAVVDHGVEHSGCSTGAEPDGGRAEATRAAKYEGDGERPITTQVAESISKRERIVKKDATGTSPVTDQANDRNPAAPVTTSACTTPTTPLTAAWPGPRQDSGGATQEVVNEKGVRQEVLVDGASGTHTEPDGDGLREALVGFYGVHNPDRISTLDTILAQYRGKEGLLIERLEQKYSADLSYARQAARVRSSSMSSESITTVPSFPSAAAPATAPPLAASTKKAAPSSGPHSPPQPTTPRHSTIVGAAATIHENHGSSLRRGNGVSRVQASEPRPAPLASQHNTALSGGTAPSSSYMTYLADQMRSKVETLLPSSGSGHTVGSGVGDAPYNYRPQQQYLDGRAVGFSGTDSGGGVRMQRSATQGPSYWGNQTNLSASDGNASGLVSSDISGAGSGVAPEDRAGDVAFARVKVLEEERAGLIATCRRLQNKAEAAAREAAATEELREAGQRKIAAFADRAAAAERQAREATVRIRALESGQGALRVLPFSREMLSVISSLAAYGEPSFLVEAEMESAVRRCAAKHTQLLSAIDLQMVLRSQLEGLLDIVPPSRAKRKPRPIFVGAGGVDDRDSPPSEDEPPSVLSGGLSSRGQNPGGTLTEPTATGSTIEARIGDDDSGDPNNRVLEKEWSSAVCDTESGGDSGRGDESEGKDADEVKRRCSLLETALKASRSEASEARRARDAAERIVNEQRAGLGTLRERISRLEASVSEEERSGKAAKEAVRGLEAELAVALDQLRATEAKLSDQTEENARLKEELRGAAARLHTAAVARESLVSFCRQERTAVEQEAAEHVARAEESAAMRGEEGLARGLELARLAEEAGEKKVAIVGEEVDRLGKALFATRAALASSKAREQALLGELRRAAETIASFNQNASITGGALTFGEMKEGKADENNGDRRLAPAGASGASSRGGHGGVGREDDRYRRGSPVDSFEELSLTSRGDVLKEGAKGKMDGTSSTFGRTGHAVDL